MATLKTRVDELRPGLTLADGGTVHKVRVLPSGIVIVGVTFRPFGFSEKVYFDRKDEVEIRETI